MNKTLTVYLEYDLPDSNFASVVTNCLQSLGLFKVILSDCEKIEDFDSTKKANLEKCDVFALMLGILSSKVSLIRREIEIAEQKNITIVPFYMGQLHKITHLIPSLYNYQETIIGRDEKGIAIRLLEVVSLMQNRFGIPIELIREAFEKIGKYQPMRERGKDSGNRGNELRIAFRRVVCGIFKRLGYEVDGNQPIKTVFMNEFFDAEVSKNGSLFWIKCFLGLPSRKNVLEALSRLPEGNTCWIIFNARKVSEQLYSLVQGRNVLFVPATDLAKQISNSVERDYFLNKIVALSYGDLENDWEDQRFLEFINSPRQVASPTILEDPILQLRNLIKKREATESRYQELILKNPWVLGAQFESILDQRRFDDENIPDFIGIRARDGLSDIIEIKQPFLELFRQDGEFNSTFNDTWNQIEKYLNFAREEKDYLRRKGLNFDNPRCLLIAGYNMEPSCLKKIRTKERLNPSVEVITYDQLLSYAEKTVKFLREMATSS